MIDIEIQNLSKVYENVIKQSGFRNSILSLFHSQKKLTEAINSLDLQVMHGECLGIVGANGAGKTTLIKLMSGIIMPTSGSIKVLGYTPFELDIEFKKKIAFVSGQRNQLFFDLTALDSFNLLQEIYCVQKKAFKASLSELTHILEVDDLLDRPIRNLSLGERMKMEIIGALLHDPQILFLDEPTIGLDCISQGKLRQYLKEINKKRNTTIILTSHDFSDIIDVCQRCIVLSHGYKIYDENIEKLIRRFNTKKIITIYNDRKMRSFVLPNFCKIIENSDDKLVFALPPDKVGYIYNQLFSQQPTLDISIKDEDIASIISRVYKQEEISLNE